MIQENIKFSVLIPVYNAQTYLRECIESVLAQTYKNFEIVLVNDGSRDASADICDDYARRYPFIRAIHKTNQGPLHTRQSAVQEAAGDWLVFVDADDLLEPNTLETIHVKIVENDPDAVFYGFKMFSENGVFYSTAQGLSDYSLEDKSELFKVVLLSGHYNSMWCKAVKVHCLGTKDYSEFYHLRRAEDLLQTIEVLENAMKVVFTDDLLYCYRETPGSIMRCVDYGIFLDEIDVFEQVWLTLRKYALFDERGYTEFRSFILNVLTQKILAVACDADLSRKEKNELFNRIKQHMFFNDFLTKGSYDKQVIGKRHLVYFLFLHGYYWLIHLAERVFRLKKKIKSVVKA